MKVFYLVGIMANSNNTMYTSSGGNLYVSNKGALYSRDITKKIVDMRIMT